MPKTRGREALKVQATENTDKKKKLLIWPGIKFMLI